MNDIINSYNNCQFVANIMVWVIAVAFMVACLISVCVKNKKYMIYGLVIALIIVVSGLFLMLSMENRRDDLKEDMQSYIASELGIEYIAFIDFNECFNEDTLSLKDTFNTHFMDSNGKEYILSKYSNKISIRAAENSSDEILLIE